MSAVKNIIKPKRDKTITPIFMPFLYVSITRLYCLAP